MLSMYCIEREVALPVKEPRVATVVLDPCVCPVVDDGIEGGFATESPLAGTS